MMISIFDFILFLSVVVLFVLHRVHVRQRKSRDSISGVEKIAREMHNEVEQKQRAIEALAIEANAVERNVASIFKEIASTAQLMQKMHEEMRSEKVSIEQLSKKNKQFFEIVPQARSIHEHLQGIIAQADGVSTGMVSKISQAQMVLEQCDVREVHLNEKLGRLEDQMHSVIESGKETMRSLISDVSVNVDATMERTDHKFRNYEEQYLNKIQAALEQYRISFEEETVQTSHSTSAQLQKYISRIEDHKKEYSAFVDSQKHMIACLKSETLSDLEGAISRKHDELSNSLSAFEQTLEGTMHSIKDKYDQEMGAVKQTLVPVTTMVEKLQHETKNMCVEMQEQCKNARENTTQELLVLSRQQTLLATALTKTEGEFTALRDSTQQWLEQEGETLRELWHERLQGYEAEIEESVNKHRQEAESLNQMHEKTVRKLEQNYRSAQETLEGELEKTRKNIVVLREHAEQLFEQEGEAQRELWQQKLQGYETHLEEDIRKHRQEAESLREVYENAVRDIVKACEDEKVAAFESVRDSISQGIDSSSEHVNAFAMEYFNTKKAEVEETVQTMHSEHKQTVHHVLHEYKTLCDDVKLQYEQHDEHIGRKYSECLQRMDELENELQRRLESHSKIIDERADVDVLRVVAHVNTSFDTVKKSVESSQEHVEQKLASMQEHFDSAEEVIEHKLQSIQRLVQVLQDKHKKQVVLIDEDTESIKVLEKLHCDIEQNFAKAENAIVELKAKSAESDKLEKKLSGISQQVDALGEVLASVKGKDIELRRIIKDHEKMSKQVDKIDVRSGKIHDAIDLLQSKEEKIRRIKDSLTEIQITQKDIEKHRRDIEQDQVQYQLVLDSMNALERSIETLEKKSTLLQDNMNNWEGQIQQTTKVVEGITQDSEDIQGIAARVEATKKNIPEIVRKLSEIKDEQGRIAELETRLQKLNEEAADKLTLLALVTTPPSKRGKTTKIDEKTKDIIIGLNENSFKPERIAKIVGISTNEVQMVLENMFIK